MPVKVSVRAVEPMPTAVVMAATTWAEFPKTWGSMLDKVWCFLRGDATHQAVRQWSKANGYQLAGPRWEIYGDPDSLTGDFAVEVFWSLAAR